MSINSTGSARSKIINSLVDLLKGIDGQLPNNTNLYENVFNKLKFYDEVEDFPTVCLVAGPEFREYLPGEFKWGILNTTIRVFVKDEEPQEVLELILEDIECLLDDNNDLEFDTNRTITEIRITSIATDEGVLTPYGVGEINLQVRYDIT